MSMLTRLRSASRNLLRRARAERDLDDEIRSYVDLLADEKRRAGLDPIAARRAALIEAGGVERAKEEVRDAWTGAWVHGIAQDLRYGARGLARDAGLTVAVVLTLALGIGATTAVVGVVDVVLMRPLPYASAERIVVLLHGGRDPVSPANFTDWQAGTRAFAAMGAAQSWGPSLAGEGPPEPMSALKLTHEMLPLLGVPPMLGRVFSPDEALTGERVVVISHGLWQRRFAGRASVVGSELRLDGEVHTVIGVMPPSFAFAPFWVTDAELWGPLPISGQGVGRNAQSLRVFARLKEGVSVDDARREVTAVTTALEREYPGTNRDVRVRPLLELTVGEVRSALFVILAAVSLVLLIACANVAHLLLARGVVRRREVAVRTALGATRGRTIRQLLTESMLLAIAGGVGGVLIAAAAVRALTVIGPAFVPRIGTVAMDARVLAVAASVTVLTGLICGVLPALRTSDTTLADAFRDNSRGSSGGGGRRRMHGALVVTEFALAIMLMVGAGLLIRSFVALRAVNPGFEPTGLAAVTISVTGTSHEEPSRRVLFFEEVARQADALPGVASASVVNHVPLAGDVWGSRFRVEGQPVPDEERPRATWRVVLPGYFQTMRIPLRQGRAIDEGDRADAPRVVMVNEALAEAAWGAADPLGKRISFDDSSWVTVVGVVANVAQDSWAGPPQPELYLPVVQDPSYRSRSGGHLGRLTLVVRRACEPGARCDPGVLSASLRGLVVGIDPSAAVSPILSMERVAGDATGRPRFYLLLLGTFAAVGLILAAIGIYGVTSYGVSQRTREIGIRMALGADRREVIRMVAAQGMMLALVGTIVGAAGSLLLTRVMSGLLYGVSATDPATFVGVVLLLAAVALVATLIPATRAVRGSPLDALRLD